jgi:hypothetical protein
MKTPEIEEYARSLFEAHGDRAEYEAAQRAHKCEEAGDKEQAEDWRKIRDAISQLRGPHAS